MAKKFDFSDVMLGGLAKPIYNTLSNAGVGVPGLIKLLGQKDEEKKPVTPAAARPTMRKGGAVKTYAKGGSVKSSASKRADGIAQRGKTRGKLR